jgi:hypothetical protein
MTDAPERIWAAYPTSGNRVDQTIYGYGIEPFGPNDDTWIDDDFDDPCMVAEYTRTDISQARVAELEGSLDRAEMNCQYLAQEVEARQARIAQLEAANDAAEQSGQNSDGGLWRFWADKSLELATQNAALQKENAALKAKP